MPSVDNRVVEMRFDNKDFESGVSTSLSTLDKLKKSLNLKDASKGFDELDKAAGKVSFSPLMDAAEAVTNKFSALGVIGDQVLRRIGDEVANLEFKVVSLVKSMSVDQISAGWTKLNQKTQSVQTIMNSTGLSIDEVNSKLDRLMWYSDETSFGFTDMTSALETMTAKGGDIEKLIPMLMGFGNAVAYSGKSSAEFQRVLRYGLSQAYSLGYLGTRDWYSFTGAGVGSSQLQKLLLKWANELEGTAYDTGEGFAAAFSEALTNKTFTNQVMESAFNEFAEMTLEAERLIEEGVYDNATEAYAALSDQFDDFRGKSAKAAQQAKSFVEVVDAVKDAVSTGWMVTFEEIFGNLDEQVELWSWLVEEFLEVFAYGAEDRNSVLEQWHDGIEVVDDQYKDLIDTIWASDSALAESMLKSGQFTKTLSGYELAIESLHNVWDGLKNILYAVKDAWSSVLPALDAPALIRMTERVRDATAAFRDMFGYVEEKTETVKKLFGGTKEGAEEAAEAIETTSSSLDELANAVIQGNYGNGQARFDAITALGYSWQEVQNRVNELLGSSYRYETAAEDTIAVTEEESEAMESLGESTSSVAEATEEMTEEMGESTPAILAIQGAVRGIAGAVSILKQAAKAAWKVVVKPALTAALKALKPVFLWVSKIGNKIGEIAQEWEKTGKIEAFLTNVVGIFNRITAPLKTFASKVSEIFSKVKQSDAFAKLVENLGRLGDALKEIGGQVGEKFLSLFDKLNTPISGNTWVDTVVGALERGLTAINKLLDYIIPMLEKVDLSNLDDFFFGIGTEVGNIQNFFKNPLSFISGVLSNFDPLTGASNAIDSFFDTITGSSNETEDTAAALTDVAGATDSVGESAQGLLGTLSSLTDKFNFKDFISGGEGLSEVFSGLSSSISSITSDIKITDVVAVLGALTGIGLASSIKKVAKAASTTFGSISSFFTSMKRKHAIPMLIQIAIAVVAVAGAMLMIAQIDGQQLKSVIGVMVTIFGLMAGLVIVISACAKALGETGGVNAQKLGTAILMVAGSFLLIALALDKLKDIDMKGMLPKIGMIGLVMLELAVVSRIMTKGNKDGKGAISGALSMILLVGSLWLLLKVMKTIEKMSMDRILENVIKMQPIMFALLELATISRVSGKGMRGFSMLLLVADIWVLAKVLEKLRDININGVLPKLGAILGVMAVLAIIARIMGGSSEKGFSKSGKDISKTSKKATNVGWQILEMAAAIYVIAMAMEKIAALDPESAWRAAEIIDIYLGIFAVITGLSHFSGQSSAKVGMAILLMSASIFILAEAMKTIIGLLTQYGPAQVWQAAGMIDSFFGMFAIVMAASKGVTGSGVAGLFVMVLAVAAIAGALWLLKDIPINQLLLTATSIGIILLALSGSLRLLSGQGQGKVWSSVGAMVVMMGAVLLMIWGLMAILDKYSGVGDLLSKFGAIALLVVAIAAATWIISKAKFGSWGDLLKSVAAFAAIEVLVVALTAAMVWISSWEMFDASKVSSLIDCINQMIPLMYAMAGLAIIGAIVGTIGGWNALIGDLAIGAMFLVVAGIFAGIAGIMDLIFGSDLDGSKWESAIDDFDKAIVFVQKLGEFIGAFFSGIGVGLTDGLPAITQNISDAMEKLEPALETFKKIDGEVLAGATNLTLLLMELSSAEFLDAIGSPFEALGNRLTGRISGDKDAPTGLTKMMDQLKELFQGMYWIKSFMDLNGIDDAAIAKINSALDVISAMMGIELPKEGGWLTSIKEWATGSSMSPANFSLMLSTLGNGVAAFYDSISGQTWNTSKVDGALSVIESIEGLSLPKTGGWIQSIFGSQDMEKFGTGMDALGTGLNAFYTSINDEDWGNTDNLDAAIDVAGALAALNAKLPATGGKLQQLLGSTDIDNWADRLPVLADGLNAFYTSINEEDWSDTVNVDGAISVAQCLSELNNNLPPLGGILQDWLGEQSLSTWGTELEDFALSMLKFRLRASTFTEDDVNRARYMVDIMTPFLELQQTYGTIDSFSDFMTALFNSDFLSNIGTGMGDLGQGLADFQTNISTVTDWGQLDVATEKLTALMTAVMSFGDVTEQYTGLNNLDDILRTLANTSIDAFADEWDISSLNESLLPNVTAITDVFNTALDPALPELLTTIGESSGQALVNGLGSKSLSVSGKAQILKTSIINKFTNLYSRMKYYGEQGGQGLADGLNAKVNDVTAAAQTLVDAITTTTSNGLDEHSPSKILRGFGVYGGEGLALGLLDMRGRVTDSARTVALSAVNETRDTLSLLASAIDSDVDMDPTIRPVLDLSNVRAGAAQANALMSQTFSTRLGYSMAAMAGGEVQGAQNAAVTVRREQTSNYNSNFRELRADIHELKETIASMQMVMDTGAVVGALRKPMDTALGRNLKLSSRRS